MNRLFRYGSALAFALTLVSCSEVLQTVDLEVSSADDAAQEEFNVVEKTLTLSEARAQKTAPYTRQVIQSGRGAIAGPITERSLVGSNFPRSARAAPYRVGAGDRLNFTRLVDNQSSTAQVSTVWPPQLSIVPYTLEPKDKILLRRILDTNTTNISGTENWPKVSPQKAYTIGIGDEVALIQINEAGTNNAAALLQSERGNSDIQNTLPQAGQNVIRTTGRVGSDGSVLLLEVGRLDANGKTLSQLRAEVRNVLIRNGLSPKFQLDIISFASQRAYISTSGTTATQESSGAQVVTLTDKPITLRELLSRSGIGFSQSVETYIRLQQSGGTYTMTLRKLYDGNAPDIIIEDRDHIFVESRISSTQDTTITAGPDGYAVVEGIGRIRLNGRTLEQVEQDIQKRLSTSPVSQQSFQLEITSFASQRTYLTLNALSSSGDADNGRVITLTDQPITLRELLSQAGIGLSPRASTKVELQRSGQTYEMDLAHIYGNGSPNIVIQDRDHIFVETGVSQTINATALVGQDGFVVLEGIGRIEVANKTIDEISRDIRNTPSIGSAFQIEVVEFASQRALISIPGAIGESGATDGAQSVDVGSATGAIVPITNIPMTLEEALTQRGVTLDGQYVTRIKLQRQGRKYSFTLKDLLDTASARVYLQGGDRITVERMDYKSNKVFVLGGISPTIVNIDPELRQTLADILFTSGGVLSAPGANRSEVYLLRGSDPVIAYHLDFQSPTRLIVADAMELRPNDILYVSEQPIVSFNRALTTITSLRAVLQDIGSELN